MRTPKLIVIGLLAPMLFAGAVASLALSCTPAVRQAIGADLGAVAGLAPVVCAVVAAAGGDATACGPVAKDVADVAALVGDILKSWPGPRMHVHVLPNTAPMQPVVLLIRGVSVTLHPEAASHVQTALAAKK